MMNRLHAFAISLVLLGALCMSCVREAVMDAGEKPMVAVECVLSNNPVQTLYLRYTKGASKKEYEVVSEAEAVLYDLTEGTVAGSFVKSSDGVWTLDYAAIDDHEYRLEVNVPTYETITAEQKMPVRPKVSARRICYSDYRLEHDSHLEWAKACNYFCSGSGGSTWIYAMNYNKETGRKEVADYICGSGKFDDFNITDVVYMPKLDTISYSDYFPDASPVVKNVAGLYVHLYGVKMHDRYLRISHTIDAFFECMISGTFEGFYPVEFASESEWYPLNWGVITQPSDDQGYLVFATVSDDFEKYYAEAKRFIEIQESSQISDIYLRDNIYTNISNGLGIFAAKAETWMVWSDTVTIDITKGWV